jgi:hypothetical protein
MLSVRDIQGRWRENKTNTVWTVKGIVAQRSNMPKGKNKHFVLSDGPAGVEWDRSNLTGGLEGGILVWRNRKGEIMYFWEKLEGQTAPAHSAPMRATGKATPGLPTAGYPPMPQFQLTPPVQIKVDDHSPRSTNSATSLETAPMTAGMGSVANQGTDKQAVEEMKMLMEMAANRLLTGDVYMTMRYISLAQQIQPLGC